MDINHATIFHSVNCVNNGLDHREGLYVESINNWAVIFSDIMPNRTETKHDLADTIYSMLNNTMLSLEGKQDVLEIIKDKYLEKNVVV